MYSHSPNFQLPHATLRLTDQLEVTETNERSTTAARGKCSEDSPSINAA